MAFLYSPELKKAFPSVFRFVANASFSATVWGIFTFGEAAEGGWVGRELVVEYLKRREELEY